MTTLVKRALVTAVAAAALTTALPAREAHAAKIPIVYQTGEDIFVAGDGSIPKPFDAEPDVKSLKAGYKCDIFGVFGAYVTIKNCKPVAFAGDTYVDEPELTAAIAQAHPENTMQVGFWQKHGRIPLGIVLLGMVGFAVYRRTRKED